MELFDKRFVHFMWDDELEGKKCFVANGIDILINAVNKEILNTAVINRSKGGGYALHSNETGNDYYFAYYDPNYEVKKAFNDGKTIQIETVTGEWADITAEEPVWTEHDKYRVKPEEEQWIVYLARQGDNHCYLTACTEDNWEDIQKNRNVKTKLFIGSESEVEEWYESRQKFADVIKAWEDGKTIQVLVKPKQGNTWVKCIEPPEWHVDNEYRVKPEEKKEKHYQPYNSSAEMIDNYVERFNASRSLYMNPSIWVRPKKCVDHHYLITGFLSSSGLRMCGSTYFFEELFRDYEYLDGSPCGMEVK